MGFITVELAKKVGTLFRCDGRIFHDLAVEKDIRAIVALQGVLDKEYGFCWYYAFDAAANKPDEQRDNAAKALVSQFNFHLIDHRAALLRCGKLDDKGREIGRVGAVVLENQYNLACVRPA